MKGGGGNNFVKKKRINKNGGFVPQNLPRQFFVIYSKTISSRIKFEGAI